MAEKIIINTEYITLGQFLKLVNLINTGGMAKWFLLEHEVYVNGEKEERRGRKLYPGDTINILEKGQYIILGKS